MKKSLITKLDKLFREAIYKRDNYKCVYCGKTTHLNNHHLFSRSNKNLRFDLANGITLCSGHHTLCNFSAHKAPIEFLEWLKKLKGIKWYNNLRKKSWKILKVYDEEEFLEQKKKEFEEVSTTKQRGTDMEKPPF